LNSGHLDPESTCFADLVEASYGEAEQDSYSFPASDSGYENLTQARKTVYSKSVGKWYKCSGYVSIYSL
jgi:hypothetical protein